jgi:hypothetical protein
MTYPRHSVDPALSGGWFELGAPILNQDTRLFEVRRFWEKPPAETTVRLECRCPSEQLHPGGQGLGAAESDSENAASTGV